jgi:hypothetical protein
MRLLVITRAVRATAGKFHCLGLIRAAMAQRSKSAGKQLIDKMILEDPSHRLGISERNLPRASRKPIVSAPIPLLQPSDQNPRQAIVLGSS